MWMLGLFYILYKFFVDFSKEEVGYLRRIFNLIVWVFGLWGCVIGGVG